MWSLPYGLQYWQHWFIMMSFPIFSLLNMVYSKLHTKKALSLFFWTDCDDSHHYFDENWLTIFDFLLKIKIWQVQHDWHCFQSTWSKLAPQFLLDYQLFAHHVDEDGLTMWKPVFVARTATILGCTIEYPLQTEKGGWLMVSCSKFHRILESD